MVKEGLTIVKAVRERYDGRRRNPWNEVECGHHYARAMSSWGLLLALSGFSYSVPEGRIGFAPAIRPEDFQTFWSLGPSWGVYRQKVAPGDTFSVVFTVDQGSFEIKEFWCVLPESVSKKKIRSIDCLSGGEHYKVQWQKTGERIKIRLSSPVTLQARDTIEFRIAFKT
jgi:hypothetical protein